MKKKNNDFLDDFIKRSICKLVVDPDVELTNEDGDTFVKTYINQDIINIDELERKLTLFLYPDNVFFDGIVEDEENKFFILKKLSDNKRHKKTKVILKNKIEQILVERNISINSLNTVAKKQYSSTHILVKRETLNDVKLETLYLIAELLNVTIPDLYEVVEEEIW